MNIYPEISMNIHGAAVQIGTRDGHAWLEIDHPAPSIRLNVFLTPEAIDNLEMTIAELRREEERVAVNAERNGHDVTAADLPF